MTLFLLASLALAAAAIVLLTQPWWRRPRPDAAQASRTITKTPMNDPATNLRELLIELDALHRGGLLGDETHAQARAAIERKLVERAIAGAEAAVQPADAAPGGAAAPSAAPPPAPPRPPRWAWAGVVALFGAVGVGGYVWLGDPAALGERQAAAPAAAGAAEGGAPHELGAEQIAAMVARLAERLESQPDDADGWAMLARSYAVAGQHAKAVPAFRKAAALKPDDAVLLADFADALAMTQQRSLAGEPLQLVRRALKADPGNLKALSLAGTEAFNRKDYAAALDHWQKLQQRAGPDSVFAAQVRGGIDEARQLLQAAGTPLPPAALAALPSQPTVPPAADGARVSGTVTLAPALAARAAPDDTLFVFARAAEGAQRTPLAMLRKQVRDLPLTFTLDDSLAMSPAARLSGQRQVVVAARISRQGQAAPAPGDLQGQSAVVALGARGVKVEIAETVQR